MQCLMEVKLLAKHMLSKAYKGKEEGSYPVSDMMRKLFQQVFRKPLTDTKKPKLDGSFVFEGLSKLFKRVNSNDSQQVLVLLCDTLNQEFDKGKKEGSQGESAIQEVFKMELEDQFECVEEHLSVNLRPEFLMQFDRTKSVSDSIKDVFTINGETKKCDECEKEAGGFTEVVMVTAPSVLVICMKRFDDDGAEVGQKQTAPLELDLTEYYSGSDFEDGLIMDLFAMVSTEGETLEDSESRAVVLKGKQWV